MPLAIPELQPAQPPMGGSGSGPILCIPSSGSMRKKSPRYVFPRERGPCTHGGRGCREASWLGQLGSGAALCPRSAALSSQGPLVFNSSSHKDQMPTQAGMGQLQWQRPIFLSFPNSYPVAMCLLSLLPASRHSALALPRSPIPSCPRHPPACLPNPSGKMLPKEKVL